MIYLLFAIIICSVSLYLWNAIAKGTDEPHPDNRRDRLEDEL
jgi:hypothetical protein